jgi:hypothetical protein
MHSKLDIYVVISNSNSCANNYRHDITETLLKVALNTTESSRLKIHHTKPNQWSLHLSDVISLDGGLYTCVAENIAGKSMCSANLFVDGKLQLLAGGRG